MSDTKTEEKFRWVKCPNVHYKIDEDDGIAEAVVVDDSGNEFKRIRQSDKRFRPKLIPWDPWREHTPENCIEMRGTLVPVVRDMAK